MAITDDPLDTARLRLIASIDAYAAAMRGADGSRLGEGLIQTRVIKDRVEAIFVEGLGRFDKSGEYRADGAIDVIAWLRSRCRVSGAEAAQRVGVARQLDDLPMTQKAFANGKVGLQQVAVLARTAEHVGPAIMRKAEATLLGMAETMDPGQLTGVARNFEHQVDAQAALAEANRAHERRYLHVAEQGDGMVKLDGLLDAEGGAIVRTVLNAHLLPGKDDQRTPAQRRADALVEICRGSGQVSNDGSGPRPQLIVRTTVDTLAGCAGAPAGELDGGGTVPSETVQRIACDAALTRIIGSGDQSQSSRMVRTTPPATRRALAERDRGCAAEHCTRPPQWTDSHHVQHWTRGGPTTMGNLLLLCRVHHRMVHEGGYELQRLMTGRWALIPTEPRSRSA